MKAIKGLAVLRAAMMGSSPRKKPKTQSLLKQGSLRQLLRNYSVFRRFSESTAIFSCINYTTKTEGLGEKVVRIILGFYTFHIISV